MNGNISFLWYVHNWTIIRIFFILFSSLLFSDDDNQRTEVITDIIFLYSHSTLNKKKNENQENQCWKLFRIPKEKTSNFFFYIYQKRKKKERKMKRRNYNTTSPIHFFICCIESLPLKRTEQIVIIFSLYWIQANEFYWIVNSELYRICVPSI